MAIRKKGGDSSEGAGQDKPTMRKRGSASLEPTAGKKAAASKPETGSKKSASAEKSAAGSGKSATGGAASKSARTAKEAATKAVKAVTRKVADTVGELTSKRKPASKASDSVQKGARPAPGKGVSGATRNVVATAAPAQKKSTRSAAGKSRTAVGALQGDITDADVSAALLDGGSSEFTPENEIADRNPVDVREHYFGEHRQGPPMPETRELPQEYGDTKIVLLIRDPEWVYAYWEMNDATRAEFQLPRNGHHRRLVIRLYKITGRDWPNEAAHYFQDIDVSPFASSWYIKLPEVSERWCAELGIFDEQNTYISICRSNLVDTPPNTISEETDSEWMIVEESFRKLVGMAGGVDATAPGGVTMRGGSEMIIRQLQRTVTGLLSAEGSGLSSGSLYSGNFGAGNGQAQKDFWLQVHTELILFGATEPNARVTVQGQPVRLNDDGTFSVRFSLPDGEHVLRVHATNADGDMTREITPVVTKSTK